MKNKFLLILAGYIALSLLIPPSAFGFGGLGVFGGGGPPANLFPVTSNQTLYVATTGNDNNSCTSSAKCATITHAMAVLKTYDFGYQYTATVNVADGTYTGTVTLPALYHYPQPVLVGGIPSSGFPQLVGDTTTPTNAVITSASGDALNTELGAIWQVKGFQLKSTSGTNADLDVTFYSYIAINNIDFAGNHYLANVGAYSFVNAISATLSSSTSSAFVAINSVVTSWFINDSSTWTINNSPTFSSAFANVGDYGVLGAGTYVNGGTVTGQRFILYNHGTIEFASASSTFPGSTAGSIQSLSIFLGDLSTSLGAADYNITKSANWNFAPTGGVLYINTANVNASAFDLINSTSGGHEVLFGTAGSTGEFSLTAGQTFFLDANTGALLFWYNPSTSVTTLSGTLGWSAQTAFTANAADTGLSRKSAGVLAVGNGTAGDTTGTIQATHFTSGSTAGVSCSGTPTSSFASVNGIVTHC